MFNAMCEVCSKLSPDASNPEDVWSVAHAAGFVVSANEDGSMGKYRCPDDAPARVYEGEPPKPAPPDQSDMLSRRRPR